MFFFYFYIPCPGQGQFVHPHSSRDWASNVSMARIDRTSPDGLLVSIQGLNNCSVRYDDEFIIGLEFN